MAYIRCVGGSGGSIQKKTATGAVATFNTGLPAPLIDVTSAIGYRSSGYTSASVINSKTTPAIDETPYQTRINSNIGNMALEKLVGVSVCFNQLLPDASMHQTGTGTGNWQLLDQRFSLINNHVYLCLISGTFDNDTLFRFRDIPSDIATDSVNGSFIYKSTVDTNNTTGLQPKITNGASYDYYYNVIDLTAMFGSTVADYLYTLESGTAGSGVALFKSLFGEDYYPYTANTLMSAKPTGKVIKDENDQTIETIVYSGNELRGILKVGTNGLYADGDTDDGSGSAEVKWAIKTFNGSENWTVTSYNGHYRAYTSISDIKSFGGTSDDKTDNVAITDKYIVGTWYQVLTGKSVCGQTGTNVGFGIDELGITTAEAWKTWLSNNELSIIYRLATPTTQTISAWTNPIVAKEGGTETFVDTRTIALPTGHDTIYGTDLSVKKAEFGTTVYGGSVDFTTGEVISNKNADGTDKTAETISVTPVEVLSNAGTNNVFSDTNGNTTAQYIDKR